MIRALRVARRSAVKMRTQIANQMHSLLIIAPADLRERLRTLSVNQLVDTAGGMRAGAVTTPIAATKLALKGLALRHQLLSSEIAVLDVELTRLTNDVAPALCGLTGVGTDVAGALLVAVGDNPARLRSEGSFANLCSVAPLSASSGKTSNRHRLNRGGDRLAYGALWRIVMTRLRCHQPTQEYMARRTAQGMSKREIVRCLKRYVARAVYHCLVPVGELGVAA